MAWLAVNKNDDEIICIGKPERSLGGEWSYSEKIWVESECGSVELTIMLPKVLSTNS